MPLNPNFLERQIFFTFNQGPAPLLDIFGAVTFRVVLAAIRLGVFEVLSAGLQTPAEVARKIKSEERGTKLLLDTLVGFGYLTQRGERYTNSRMSAKWLTSNGTANFAPGFAFWATSLSEIWDNLEDSIHQGQPQHDFYNWIETQPETSKNFQEYLTATAQAASGEISSKFAVPPTARRLLDVGGGHGAYSIAMCRKYPALSAVVFDSPQALKTARENIAHEGMEGRVSVQEGNFLADDLGSGYDVALAFNIIHGLSAAQNQELIRRISKALNPDGQLGIVEQIAGKIASPTGRAINAMFSLTYFHLFGGTVFTYEEIARWLASAGFVNTRRKNFLRGPGSALILGTKAG